VNASSVAGNDGPNRSSRPLPAGVGSGSELVWPALNPPNPTASATNGLGIGESLHDRWIRPQAAAARCGASRWLAHQQRRHLPDDEPPGWRSVRAKQSSNPPMGGNLALQHTTLHRAEARPGSSSPTMSTDRTTSISPPHPIKKDCSGLQGLPSLSQTHPVESPPPPPQRQPPEP
jgi:hypothetical protein